MPRRYYFSLDEAIAYIASLGLSCRTKYREWHTQQSKTCRPPVPYNPEKHYRDKWPGWAAYLSKRYVTEPELYELVQSLQLSTIEAYRREVKDNGKLYGMPPKPENYYPSVGQSFRGYKQLLFKNQLCLACASAWAGSQKTITTPTQWLHAGRSVIPKNIHLNLSKYGDIDFKKFIQGGYSDDCNDCCTCR